MVSVEINQFLNKSVIFSATVIINSASYLCLSSWTVELSDEIIFRPDFSDWMTYCRWDVYIGYL